MITDPRTNAAHGHRWVLWLFVFAGVVVHSSLCPPNVHAGVLSATTRACVSSASGTPPPAEPSRGETPDTDSVADAGRPCAPAPHPHHHPPCGVIDHRGSAQQRALGPWHAAAVPWLLPATPDAGAAARPVGVRSGGRWSRPPAARAGAGLLIDLCSSRT
ncbi:hypothetical protein [Actinoallomurus iriomotensis]|uniref:Uncharacterized protein n=1 Tax=Actinoallomurus iriomotensis TaxID=478107 RepID=A0A9W6SCU3_9ACTN|nr:hypothetical protein [Actinoallomurus iriomotensis]GLY92460.1 hypothetical protein Airi02_103880 [Actinoallomurus iriomotensis]